MKLLFAIIILSLLAASYAATSTNDPGWDGDDDFFANEGSFNEASDAQEDAPVTESALNELEARYPPTKDGQGFEVPLKPIWLYHCEGSKMPNDTEYKRALEHMRWFCKQKIFNKWTSMHVAVVGETLTYVCSKFGAANPCRPHEYALGERAINEMCGVGMAGWVKLQGWPRIYGRATINTTICQKSNYNHWGRTKFQVAPGPFWVDNMMYEEWRDGHGFYNTTWVEPYKPWEELWNEAAYNG